MPKASRPEWDGRYPVRCRIVDPAQAEVIKGIVAISPPHVRPHINKTGLADRDGLRIRIALDDGTILWGHECWWMPESAVEEARDE